MKSKVAIQKVEKTATIGGCSTARNTVARTRGSLCDPEHRPRRDTVQDGGLQRWDGGLRQVLRGTRRRRTREWVRRHHVRRVTLRVPFRR
jgi:hypothetical protein